MTPLGIIKDAMLEIGVLQSGESPTDAEAKDSLGKFNDMLSSGELDGLNLGHVTAGLNTELPFPTHHRQAFMYNLAVLLCPMFGVNPNPVTVQMAQNAAKSLKNYYLDIANLRTDDAIHPAYSPNRYFH